MLLGESEFARQVLAHQIAVEQSDRTSAHLEEFGDQSVGDGRFARSRKPGKENGDALFVPRRIAAAQFLHHFGIGEPRRDVAAFIEALAQFRPGDVEHLGALRYFVGRNVTVFVLQIHHHLEGNHDYTHFLLMLLKQFLGVIRTVEVLAVGIFSGTGMIAADDEMRAAMIFANQAVPHCFTRSAHAHGERQHGELDRAVGILREQQLVTAGADEIIDVARLGHADRGMDQQIRLDLLGGAHGQFDVRPMHGIARLEGHDFGPAHAAELGAQVGGSEAQRAEIIMRRSLYLFHLSAHVPGIRFVDGVIGARMRGAGGTENRLGFGFAIRLPHIFNAEHGEHHPFGIAQCDLAAARRQFLGEVFAHIERDRHGPQGAVCQTHVVADALVIGAVHEATQRRETAAHQQFQIAKLARGQVP